MMLRSPIPLLIIATAVVVVACSAGASPAGTPSPLPPVAELATSEGLLDTASERLRNCLTATFTDGELEQNLELYVRHPFSSDPFQQCDPSGMEILSSAGGAVVDGLPGAAAPFGLDSTKFPDTHEGILALYERADFRGNGVTRGDEMQVEVSFEDGDADAVSIAPEFSGLPENTSPAVMIGTMLIFVDNDVPPDSRLGGTDGTLTWLKFVPPQTPDKHTMLWARTGENWAFSATANTEADLEELVRALVEAAKSE